MDCLITLVTHCILCELIWHFDALSISQVTGRLGSGTKGQEAVFLCPSFTVSKMSLAVLSWMFIRACLLSLTVLLNTGAWTAYADEFLQAFRNLGLDPWAGMQMDVAWRHATLRYGLHWPSIIFPWITSFGTWKASRGLSLCG